MEYIPRLIERKLASLIANFPAVMLVGPRAGGKTTTAQRYAATVVRLDREAEAIAFRADPDSALAGLPEPILLDEWQMVPGVLGAVKRSVDGDPRPGRFLITGSVRADLQGETWPGTGRVIRLSLHGLTVKELHGASPQPSFFDRIANLGVESVPGPATGAPDLREYLDLALAGGFPESALLPDLAARRTWLDSYIDQLLTRDVGLVESGRDPDRLRRFLGAYAAMTAQVVEEKTLWEAAGINRKTAIAYEQLLRNLFVVDQLPAWSESRLKQLTRSPKRFIVDPGLACAVLRTDVRGLMREGHLLGPTLETFVMAQLRAEATVAECRPRLYHLRTRAGRQEVDIVAEVGPGRVLGIEVKAAAAPRPDDFEHLRWLRDVLGDRFAGGILFHTGPRAYIAAAGIVSLPIASLWHRTDRG